MKSIRAAGLKLHLRAEDGGQAVLTVNANYLLYLDRVAAAFVRAYLAVARGRSGDDPAVEAAVTSRVRRRFRVKGDVALTDWRRVWSTITSVAGGGTCPFSDLGVSRVEPFSQTPRAPFRIDLALTYRCNNDCGHCYAGGSRKGEELTTNQWRRIIDRAVAFDVPTLVFTGGESILRPDLPDLVAHAQARGAVTGLITNGRLMTPEAVTRLAGAGLDFVQITLESVDPAVHAAMVGRDRASWEQTVAGIRNSVARLYTTTNTTIMAANAGTILDTIRFLKGLGVSRFGLNAIIRAGRGWDAAGVAPSDLNQILAQATALAHELELDFIWYTPTCYHDVHPVDLGAGVKTCTAARTVLAIEPDGNVMPCQSYFQSLGNARRDSFAKMWRHPLAVSLRNRDHLPDRCRECDEVGLCGGGCPLEHAGRTEMSSRAASC